MTLPKNSIYANFMEYKNNNKFLSTRRNAPKKWHLCHFFGADNYPSDIFSSSHTCRCAPHTCSSYFCQRTASDQEEFAGTGKIRYLCDPL